MKPLSNLQKATLATLARHAFYHMSGVAGVRGEAWDLSSEALATWRREQVRVACGRFGLSQAGRNDYCRIKAHFESLMGEDGRALESLLDAETEPKRQAKAVLVREMERGGFGPQYVQAICSAQFKCAVEDATADQVKNLIVTIKTRAAAKRRKEAAVPMQPNCHPATA